jgi:putative membrane protein
MMSVLDFLIPWEPSPLLVAVFVVCALVFWRGARHHTVSRARRIAFWSGLALFYVSLHTHLDYYAEHEFFMHRIQHLVLHHLAPLIIMSAYPGVVMRAGLPLGWRIQLRRAVRSSIGRRLLGVVMHPGLVSSLFIFSVLIWLVPSVQFVSMLDWRLYRLMNWSVAITGMMYWAMLLDRRPSPPARMRPGLRVLSPVITMTPQILAGAFITFSQQDLYPIFDICGRAMALPALIDQSLGGLIMWVPAAILEAIGAMLALRHLMQLSTRNRLAPRAKRPTLVTAGSPP